MKPWLYTLIFSSVTGLFYAAPSLAQVPINPPQAFTVTRACEAYVSLRQSSQPTTLEIGKTYTATAENKQPDATHALLRLPEGSKWVALNCGHYDGSTMPLPTAHNATNTACLPFFDTTDNPVTVKIGGTIDMTPPPPTLNAFDEAVNATCGAAGKVVSRSEFQDLLRNHPDVLQRLMAFTNNKVTAQTTADAENYLQALTDAWFNLKAFDHIFCGEVEDGKIGGLHFAGRYLQLQHSGEACRMDNYRQNEAVADVLYTMGVSMKAADGNIARHATKGYGITLNAEDLLKIVTRAFVENPTSGKESTACLLPVSDGGKDFTAVFVRRGNGIRTFYPDATPAAQDPKCHHPISLN